MFSNLKKAVTQQFDRMAKSQLFIVDYDRTEIFEEYLNGFSEELKQEHNCNCCKSFIRQMGGVVQIVDNKLVSIWDELGDHPEYNESIRRLKKYVKNKSVVSTFTFPMSECGTDKNFDKKRNIFWQHFSVHIPRNVVTTGGNTSSTNQSVFKGSLNAITVDSLDTVLELIKQNSIYRGQEFKGMVEEFRKLKVEYDKVPNTQKELFCWQYSTQTSSAVGRIKNSAIGTLLEDLSGGTELDDAVRKFEKVVAPTNYKRPTALVTPKMVADAKAKLTELGLLDAIERRHATARDLNMENVLFVDKSTAIKDVFEEISKTVINPKTLTKIEEITIEEFLKNVVPTAKSIEVLVENRHAGNFVSLLTSDDQSKLFKWNNNFSWDYSGGVTDSIKERVKAAGGKTDGILRVSLAWFNTDDLDLHCFEPDLNHIFFANRCSRVTNGTLDVDMNVSSVVRDPVENIIWTSDKILAGNYLIKVHNFRQRESVDSGYVVQLESNGELHELEFNKSPRNHTDESIKFKWDRQNGITLDDSVKSKLSSVSREKWGINSNTFVKVKQLMLSPNFWGTNKTGNKHYIFMLENCKSDEKARGFYNEFLNDDLAVHRKVFEILGSKCSVPDADVQLSGLGFSETQRNSVFVRVEGAFKRTLKVSF